MGPPTVPTMSRTSGLAAWLASLRTDQLRRCCAAGRTRPARRSRGVSRELAGRLNGQRSIALAAEQLEPARAAGRRGGARARRLRPSATTCWPLLGDRRRGRRARGSTRRWTSCSGWRWSGRPARRCGCPGRGRQVLPNPLGAGPLRAGALPARSPSPSWPGSGPASGSAASSASGNGSTRSPRAVGRSGRRRPAAGAGPARSSPSIVGQVAWHGPRLAGVHFPNELPARRSPTSWAWRWPCRAGSCPPSGASGRCRGSWRWPCAGPDYHAPFTAEPPAPATAADRTGSGSPTPAGTRPAPRWRRCAGCSRCWTERRRPPCSRGGVGVRELRRIAKQLSTDEPAIRLWLETAAARRAGRRHLGRGARHRRRRRLAHRRSGRGAGHAAAGLVAGRARAQPPGGRIRQGAARADPLVRRRPERPPARRGAHRAGHAAHRPRADRHRRAGRAAGLPPADVRRTGHRAAAARHPGRGRALSGWPPTAPSPRSGTRCWPRRAPRIRSRRWSRPRPG